MSGKKKKEATSVGLTNKVDVLFQLVDTQAKRIDALEKDLEIINTDYSFHSHSRDVGPKYFNKAFAEQWQREQQAQAQARAGAEAATKEPPKKGKKKK